VTKTELHKIAATVAPTSFTDPVDYLGAVYGAIKDAVARYGYERFSTDLGFGANNIAYLMLHRQRPLTRKTAVKIASALGLRNLDRRYFLQLVEAQRSSGDPERPEVFERLVDLKAKALPKALPRQQLEFYNQWYHSAILALLDLPDAKDDPEWIASQLMPHVTPSRVKDSLALLKKLDYIAYDEAAGRLKLTRKVVNTGPEVLGLAIIRYHQQMLTLARDALTDTAPEDRDISSVTISIASHQLTDIKTKIHALQNELLAMSEAATNADEVAQINVQVFPIARINKKGR